jgi:tetratricopeptide (TPR) repeat protein
MKTRRVAPAPSIENNRARLRLRRKLLLFGLPVVLVLTVLAGWILSRPLIAADALIDYSRGGFTSSADTFGSLLEPNVLEPWIPYFDRGVALAAAEDYVPAIDDFERALTLVPESRECEVVVNLALGWEKLADGYAGAGLFAGAELLYQTALDVLAAHDCTPPDEPVNGRDPGQELDDAQARLEEKLDAAEYLDDLNNGSDAANPEEQRQQLEQQGQDASEDKAEDDARQRGEGGGGGFTDKPW